MITMIQGTDLVTYNVDVDLPNAEFASKVNCRLHNISFDSSKGDNMYMDYMDDLYSHLTDAFFEGNIDYLYWAYIEHIMILPKAPTLEQDLEILEYFIQNALSLYEVKHVPIEQLVKQAKSQNQLHILFSNLKKAALQTQRYNSCIAGKKVRTNKKVYLQYKPTK